MATVDIAVLLIYLTGVIAFGCWFVRRSGSTQEFMIAGGRLPGWAVGLSIFGTYLSSNTFLGVPGKAYATNFNAFVFSLSLPLAAWIAQRVFVPFYRRSGQVSAYEHLEERFGAWARTYAVVCYLLTQLARTASILFGVALGLHALTHWPVATIILVTGALVTLYTLLGGIEAVIWTDVAQSLVLMVGAMVVLGMVYFSAPGGPLAAVELAADRGKFSLGSWGLDWTQSTVWVMLLYGLFINLNNFGIDQSFVQRYHTARSDAAAARAVWSAALLYVPISLIFFLIGAGLFAYYESRPDMRQEVAMQVARSSHPDASDEDLAAIATGLSTAEIGDKVLPHFIATQLPTGLAGLLIAAIFAAAMSSIDTSLNSSATIFYQDIFRRYWRPQCSESTALLTLRIATIIMGVMGTGMGLALIGVQSILDAWWTLQGVFAGGVLGLFLLGMAVHYPRTGPAVLATAAGIGCIAWLSLSPMLEWVPPSLRNPLHANLTIVAGTLTIFVVGWLLHSVGNRWSVVPKRPVR
ncbi:MAG: sodium:solute symporter [Planctomycetota bacterium]|nr:MAG: sodium:solute symporter [Planctomycetota bacterium]